MLERKTLVTEGIWLVGLLVFTFLLDFFMLDQSSLGRRLVDIQLHDTFYGLSGTSWLLTIFGLVALPVYLVKEGRNRFRRAIPNVFLAFLLLISLFVLFFWHRITLQVQTGGWVVYPPLSSDPDLLEKIERTYSSSGNTIFFLLELILATGLFVVGVRIGRIWDAQ